MVVFETYRLLVRLCVKQFLCQLTKILDQEQKWFSDDLCPVPQVPSEMNISIDYEMSLSNRVNTGIIFHYKLYSKEIKKEKLSFCLFFYLILDDLCKML